jgi:hypothetical protein
VKPELGAAQGDGVVAIGNILSTDRVPGAMVGAFLATPGLPLAERLMRGLEAGEAAGGEHGAVSSASLMVVWRQGLPPCRPARRQGGGAAAGLRALWEAYAPMADGFLARALEPDEAPLI